MVQVVAAVIERDGRILIGRRTARQSHALQWEFPGGKVEPGETPEQALARELVAGKRVDGIMVPPPVAIAHHLIRAWALSDK